MKIIGIGLQKTGTTSLTNALNILGFKALHFHKEMISKKWYKGEAAPRHEIIDFSLSKKYDFFKSHDAITDNPVCLPEVYEEIEQGFSDAKFILTTRPIDKWIRSVIRHKDQEYYKNQFQYRIDNYKDYDPKTEKIFTCNNLGLLEYVYGEPYLAINDDMLRSYYNRHIKMVEEYFQHKPEKLLVLDIDSVLGWDELCSFTNRSIPKEPYPHAHKTKSKAYLKFVKYYHPARVWMKKNLGF